jgi:hypothetical protein
MVEQSGADLQAIYKQFCGTNPTMDGKSFAKMSKDTKILDKKLTATDIDLIFAKSKQKTERKISYAEFQKAVGFCAEKKGISADDLAAAICAAGGPKFAGTKADNVKFHDDKDQYTGVHAQGGPTTVDSVHPVASFGGAPDKEEKKGSATKSKQATTASAPAGSIDEVFHSYTAKAKEMEGKTLAKLAKESKLLDKKLTATDIDLIFAKVKTKGARKITLPEFNAALDLMADKKGMSHEDIRTHLMASGGVSFKGTKAEAVKYHDDKSMYTGVHGKGGPSTTGDGTQDLSALADRSAADVRGIKK